MTLVSNINSVKIPATFINNRYDYNNYYILNVDIGFPRKPYKLALDFTSSIITLYQPLDKISNSYSTDKTDYIYIEKLRYRAPVAINYYTKATHDGTIGFNKSSFIWDYFSEISISASGIKLGAMHELIKNGDGCNIYVSNCIESDHLCTTRVTINKVTYDMSFSGKSQHILPSKEFNSYMSGKSLFSDSPQKWDNINVQLNQRNSFSKDQIAYFNSSGLDIINCRSNVNISIEGENVVPQTIKSSYKMMMNSHEKNEVVIGLETWKNYIIYYNRRYDTMIVKNHVVQSHFSFGNIFSFCFLLTLFVRWKLINTGKLVTTTHGSITGKWILFVCQMISMPFTIYLYCLSVTRSILDGYVGFTITIGIVVLLFICSLIYTMLIIFWKYRKVSFIWGSINAVSYDNVLLYGMWLAIIERRTDGLESFFTLVINIIIIYCIVYHMLVVIGYVYLVYPPKQMSQISTKIDLVCGQCNVFGIDECTHISTGLNNQSKPTEKPPIKPYFWIYGFVVLPILFGYQLYITYTVFAYPMITLFQPELSPTSIFLLLFVFFLIMVVFATYMSALSVTKAMDELVYEKRK